MQPKIRRSTMSVTVGLKGRAEAVVNDSNTAQSACSGALPVFGTPFMCALMEEASWKSIAPHLEEGQSTVGTRLEVSHDSATPLGMKVWAESEITQADGKRIVLKVAAYDEKGLIGQGVHERFIVTDERFLAKAARKREG
jgi:fluoroacetyl-CoA thioesterase